MLSELLGRLKLPAFSFSPVELEKRYRSLLIMLGIAAVTYALVGIFYNAVSMKLMVTRIVKTPQDRAMPAALSVMPPADSYALIPQRNLFGSTDKAVSDKKPEKGMPTEGPDLALILEIKGTVSGTGKDGFAVIEEKGKKQVLYKVGNVVAGAKVIGISRNAVTFQIGDKERVLKMAETKEVPLLSSRPAQQPVSTPARPEPLIISRSDVSASLKDMGTMMSQAQIRPYYSAGAPDGFMVTNIKPGSIYEKIGLAEGDIIQGADDRKLLTADDMTALYNSMKTSTSFTLRISRGGRQENLQYVFR